MRYSQKFNFAGLDKTRNRMRRQAALRSGSDIYLDTKGRARYSRNIKAGEKIVVSNGEHKNIITKLLARI